MYRSHHTKLLCILFCHCVPTFYPRIYLVKSSYVFVSDFAARFLAMVNKDFRSDKLLTFAIRLNGLGRLNAYIVVTDNVISGAARMPLGFCNRDTQDRCMLSITAADEEPMR